MTIPWLKRMAILAAALVLVSCADSNRRYVRKAVRIMDKQGIWATDSRRWEEYESAMDARPSSREEAQEIVRAAAKVAGGKHSFLQLPPFSGNQAEGVKYASAVLEANPDDDPVLCFRTRKRTQWIPLSYAVQVAGYASANQPFALPGGDRLVLTTGCDVARTGEVFCDDPIAPDVVSETPLKDALAWLNNQ